MSRSRRHGLNDAGSDNLFDRLPILLDRIYLNLKMSRRYSPAFDKCLARSLSITVEPPSHGSYLLKPADSQKVQQREPPINHDGLACLQKPRNECIRIRLKKFNQ